MITRENIKDKLLAFYEGKSSREDERALYVYFSTEAELSDDLKTDRESFILLFESGESEHLAVPSGLEGDLNRLIDRLSGEEKKKTSRLKGRRLLWVGGVAASLVVGLFLGARHLDLFSDGDAVEYVADRDTFTDPKDAYKATEGALLYTSAKLNKALERMDKESKKKENRE